MLAEQVGMQVRQLDRVADLVDLRCQTTDVVVVDVGDLFEHEFLDLGLRDALVDVAGAWLQQQRVPGAQRLVAQRLGEPNDALLVGVADDEGSVAVLHELLEHHDVADGLELQRGHDVECLVQHDLLATPQLIGLDGRADVHPQLAAAGEDVDAAVLVPLDEGAEPSRRLREPVDLLLQRDDLVAGLAQRGDEAVVLGAGLGELLLQLHQPVLQRPDLARRVGELATQAR